MADEDGETAETGEDKSQIYGTHGATEQHATHGSEAKDRVHIEHEVKSWEEYKGGLLDLLKELREHVIKTMKQAQDDEVLSGVGLADFKLFIERENKGLERDLADQETRREELAVQQKKNEWKIAECVAELQTDQDALYVAKNEYEGTHTQYQENRAAKESEREIYEYILGLYEG
jgi:hypothetical protein